MVTPDGTELNATGQEIISMNVSVVRYRPHASANWSNASADPGMLAGLPEIIPQCNPKCTSASLRLVQTPNVNGEVEYRVTMGGGSNVSATFRVTVQLAFSITEAITVDEDAQNTSFPSFITMSFVGTAATLPSISFTFTRTNGSAALFISPPHVDYIGWEGSFEMSFELAANQYGVREFNVSASDGTTTSMNQSFR